LEADGTADLTLAGNALNNSIWGNAGNNTLSGGAGNDFLNGGTGADTLTGGTGDDVYAVDNAGDVVIEAAGEGDDDVHTSINYTLPANVERLEADGTADLALFGNALNNGIWGNAGNNTLTGGGGNDYQVGNAGNDTYVFNRGDGQDAIDNLDVISATDTLRFGSGISDTDVTAMQSGTGLLVKLNGSSDQVYFFDYFDAKREGGVEPAEDKLFVIMVGDERYEFDIDSASVEKFYMKKFRPQSQSKLWTMQSRRKHGTSTSYAWQTRVAWVPVGWKPNQISIARRFAQLHYLACHAPVPVQQRWQPAYQQFFIRHFGTGRATVRYLNRWSCHSWL
jgi:hypothetical protein